MPSPGADSHPFDGKDDPRPSDVQGDPCRAHGDRCRAQGDRCRAHADRSRLDLADPGVRRVELDRLFGFAEAALPEADMPFAWLDSRGSPDVERGYPLWITARMTHVFGLAAMRGRPGARRRCEAGVRALRQAFRDTTHGGWYASLGPGLSVDDDRKTLYEHAFVLLAATTAVRAGAPGAEAVLDAAVEVLEQRFWDPDEGLAREGWNAVFTVTEPYRGANAHMHLVEASLAVADLTGERVWAERAAGIATRLMHEVGSPAHWRLPEHFDARWRILRDYNAERPGDPFRPYGVTVGHLLEWSRLLLCLEHVAPRPWLLGYAKALFDTAVQVGWEADGHPGLVYTVDWQDHPVVTARMHWVAAEGALAAEALAARTSAPGLEGWTARMWGAAAAFVDLEHGGWHHELDQAGSPAATVWHGKPDAYHVVQAMLLPDLPAAASVSGALAAETRNNSPRPG
ncbi:MAG: AGE family epimerase/isomerase [Nocardioidaceae bacterium]